VRDDYEALYGKRWEEPFHAPADCPLSEAKMRHSDWEGQVVSRIAALRAKHRGEGHDLTQREARALAGEWYKWFVAQHEDPGSAGHWAKLREVLIDRIEMVALDDEAHETGEIDFEAPAVREEIHPVLADEAKTAQFLASKGEVLTPTAMTLFLDQLLREFLQATALLERRASGDYSSDQHLLTLPEYRPKAKPMSRGAGKTCLELFEAYVKAVKPARSTVNRWRVIFTTLDKHLDGRDLGTLSADEAQRWAASLITASDNAPTDKPARRKRGRRTVSDIWVTAAKTVFAWALAEKYISANAFADVSIRVPKKVINREDGKAFSDAEQQIILKAALAIKDTKSPFKAACRWVPWLCAYSGARAGEITQLRKQDIERRDGYVVMKITPEAGTVKGAMPRTVPIHDHVIEQGFLDYVKSRSKGPLFYNPAPKGDGTDTDITNPKRPRYVKTRERLAEWVRKLGITDPDIQPNHAWRYTFKQRAARAGIEKVVRDTICGHATKAIADEYERPTLEDMARALKQFPRYKIDNPKQPQRPQTAPRVSEGTESEAEQ
jgi:integrase